jgi:hypothetical protein
MSLASEQDYVVSSSIQYSAANRFSPVKKAQARCISHAAFNRIRDCVGVFRARVVGGDDHPVGARRGHPSHLGTLAGIAIAAGAEHHYQFTTY